MTASVTDYVGAKWGPFLRAPDLYFELLEQARGRCVQLGTISTVTYGIKSGADAFFYVRDVTEAELRRPRAEALIRERYGLELNQLTRRRLRLIRGLGRLVVPIENRFLRPIIFNLMEVSTIKVDEHTARRRAVVIDGPRQRLRGTHALQYVRHGEREDIHERPTCANRATRDRNWYELRPPSPATVLWSQAHQYRHIAPFNPDRCLHNKRFFSIHVGADIDDKLTCAILNSSLVCFYKLYLGRLVGREGIIDTDVSAVEELWVPDPRAFSADDASAALEAFESMCNREIDAMAPRGTELENEDRQALDEAVLRACGITEAEETRARLYDELTRRFTETRELEEIAIHNRARAARSGRGPSADDLAQEVVASLGLTEPLRFPDDFLQSAAETEIVEIPGGTAEIGTSLFSDDSGSTAEGSVRFGASVVALGDTHRAEYVAELARVGLHGGLAVPTVPSVCLDALEAWRGYEAQVTDQLVGAIADRTANEQLQRRTLLRAQRAVFVRG